MTALLRFSIMRTKHPASVLRCVGWYADLTVFSIMKSAGQVGRSSLNANKRKERRCCPTSENMTFETLYNRLLKAGVAGNLAGELNIAKNEGYNPYHLDCLLNPQNHQVVIRTDACDCSQEQKENCKRACMFDALFEDKDGNIDVRSDKCAGCGDCICNCKAGKLTESRDVMLALEVVRNPEKSVFAMIAPAFVNQYPGGTTPGKLRAAFKKIGFAGMVEVALFADILTLKETLEFEKNVRTEQDFILTSCCCPMWIAMIRKVYGQLTSHIPPSVSPMVACGRAIKRIYPGAVTVFIGPCMAKKAEAREPDVGDSTDIVLTFKEIQDIFDCAGIDPAEMEEDDRDHSSEAGRIYAGSGGVSRAVRNTVERMYPNSGVQIKTRGADGVPACRSMLEDILSGRGKANFYEGMGCVGGCVGGPKALIPREEGRENVIRYGSEATYKTPVDNPYVIKLLHQLGLETIDSLISESDIFERQF